MASNLPPLLQASAAATGSAIANAIVFPLDLVTTRLQTARTTSKLQKRANPILILLQLIRQRGLLSLYDGLGADTISTIVSSFLYYFLYSLGRRIATIRQGRMTAKRGAGTSPALNAWEELGIGLAAGVVSKSVTLPASNICVRQQAAEREVEGGSREGRNGMLEVAREMYEENGIKAFWRGLGPSIPLALMPALSLYLDQLLLRMLVRKERRAHPSGATTFVLGALSNAMAILPLYPLVLLKVLSQSQRKSRPEGPSSMLDRAGSIYREDGLQALYKGIEGQLSKALVQQGVTLLIKQRVEEAVVRAYSRKRVSL